MSWTLRYGYQSAISVVVLAILLAQAATLVPTAFGRGTGGMLWPILTYGMYATSNQPGQTINVHYLLSGVTDDGEPVDITHDDLDLRFFDYQLLTFKLIREDTREGVAILQQRYPENLSEISVKTYPLKLTREGAVPTPSTVVKRIDLSTEGRQETLR